MLTRFQLPGGDGALVQPKRRDQGRNRTAIGGSILLADGQNIDAVTELLGHSSRSVTERIYAHALPEKTGGR